MLLRCSYVSAVRAAKSALRLIAGDLLGCQVHLALLAGAKHAVQLYRVVADVLARWLLRAILWLPALLRG